MSVLSAPHLKLEHRPDTQDVVVFHEIFVKDIYHLGEMGGFSAQDIIVDIGAHIGCFSAACLVRGAGEIFAFEPDPDNFSFLQKNLGAFKNVQCTHAAVWRSDRKEPLFHTGYPSDLTACGTVMPGFTLCGESKYIPVPSLGLDQIIQAVLGDDPKKKIRLLKLDCEGSEYAILFTSKMLHRVEQIIGEAHDLRSVPPSCKVEVIKG